MRKAGDQLSASRNTESRSRGACRCAVRSELGSVGAEPRRFFFAIKNIEKESRFINLDFSSNQPQDLVDCGTSTLTIDDSQSIESRSLKDFQRTIVVAASDQYPFVYKEGFYTYVGSTSRQTALSGSANIFIAPHDDRTTKVHVNVRYVLDIRTRRYDSSGKMYEHRTDRVVFATNEPSQEDVTCTSRGTLEQRIIEMVKKSAP